MTGQAEARDVLLVRFPFTSLESTKKRPALCLFRTDLSTRVRILTVAMITSKVEGPEVPGDAILDDWEGCGLLHPSLVRISKVATLDDKLVDKKLGVLTRRDADRVSGSLRNRFSAWLT